MCSPPTKHSGCRDARDELEPRSLVSGQWAEACVGLLSVPSLGEAGHSHGGKSCLCVSHQETGLSGESVAEVSSQRGEALLERKVAPGLGRGLGNVATLL